MMRENYKYRIELYRRGYPQEEGKVGVSQPVQMRLLVDGKFESDDGSFSRQSKTRVRCSHGEVVLGITMPAR